ncbi:hypothetical protein F4808DRAFT_77613 [Astrocystis sublimbata]|nr:hypothetical protein F4808DRAFT_77613 [Astrocystis sublimbata]
MLCMSVCIMDVSTVSMNLHPSTTTNTTAVNHHQQAYSLPRCQGARCIASRPTPTVNSNSTSTSILRAEQKTKNLGDHGHGQTDNASPPITGFTYYCNLRNHPHGGDAGTHTNTLTHYYTNTQHTKKTLAPTPHHTPTPTTYTTCNHTYTNHTYTNHTYHTHTQLTRPTRVIHALCMYAPCIACMEKGMRQSPQPYSKHDSIRDRHRTARAPSERSSACLSVYLSVYLSVRSVRSLLTPAYSTYEWGVVWLVSANIAGATHVVDHVISHHTHTHHTHPVPR